MTELTLLSGYRGQLAGRGHEICLSQAIPSVCPERAGVFPPIPWPVAAPPLPLGGQAPPHVPGWDKETLRRSSHRGSPGPGVCTRGFFLAQKEQQWSGCLRTCLITRPAGAETLCLPLSVWTLQLHALPDGHPGHFLALTAEPTITALVLLSYLCSEMGRAAPCPPRQPPQDHLGAVPILPGVRAADTSLRQLLLPSHPGLLSISGFSILTL